MSAVFFGGCMQTEQGRAATQNSSYSIFEVVFKCLRAVAVNGRTQKGHSFFLELYVDFSILLNSYDFIVTLCGF